MESVAPDPAQPFPVGTLSPQLEPPSQAPSGLPGHTGPSLGLRSEGPHLQVLELVSSDSLNVPSEEDVYRAVLSWVKHDVDTRRQHVPRVRPSPEAPMVSGRDTGD